MKKFLLFTACLTSFLHAQDTVPNTDETPTPEELAPEVEDEPQAVVVSTKAAQNSGEWENWVFAAGAAVVLTAGVLIVTLNTGATTSGN